MEPDDHFVFCLNEPPQVCWRKVVKWTRDILKNPAVKNALGNFEDLLEVTEFSDVQPEPFMGLACAILPFISPDQPLKVMSVVRIIQQFSVDDASRDAVSDSMLDFMRAAIAYLQRARDVEIIKDLLGAVTDVVWLLLRVAAAPLADYVRLLLSAGVAPDCQMEVVRVLLGTVNQLLEPLQRYQRTELRAELAAELPTLLRRLTDCGDFDVQTSMVECLYRLSTLPERPALAAAWLPTEQLRQLFVTIASFDSDCRLLLNVFNARLGAERTVHSFPAESVTFGTYQLQKPNDPAYQHMWVDFNEGSGTVSVYCQRPVTCTQTDDTLWETVTVRREDVERAGLWLDADRQRLTLTLTRPCRELFSSGALEAFDGRDAAYVFRKSHDLHTVLGRLYGGAYRFQPCESLATDRAQKASAASQPVHCRAAPAARPQKASVPLSSVGSVCHSTTTAASSRRVGPKSSVPVQAAPRVGVRSPRYTPLELSSPGRELRRDRAAHERQTPPPGGDTAPAAETGAGLAPAARVQERQAWHPGHGKTEEREEKEVQKDGVQRMKREESSARAEEVQGQVQASQSSGPSVIEPTQRPTGGAGDTQSAGYSRGSNGGRSPAVGPEAVSEVVCDDESERDGVTGKETETDTEENKEVGEEGELEYVEFEQDEMQPVVSKSKEKEQDDKQSKDITRDETVRKGQGHDSNKRVTSKAASENDRSRHESQAGKTSESGAVGHRGQAGPSGSIETPSVAPRRHRPVPRRVYCEISDTSGEQSSSPQAAPAAKRPRELTAEKDVNNNAGEPAPVVREDKRHKRRDAATGIAEETGNEIDNLEEAEIRNTGKLAKKKTEKTAKPAKAKQVAPKELADGKGKAAGKSAKQREGTTKGKKKRLTLAPSSSEDSPVYVQLSQHTVYSESDPDWSRDSRPVGRSKRRRSPHIFSDLNTSTDGEQLPPRPPGDTSGATFKRYPVYDPRSVRNKALLRDESPPAGLAGADRAARGRGGRGRGARGKRGAEKGRGRAAPVGGWAARVAREELRSPEVLRHKTPAAEEREVSDVPPAKRRPGTVAELYGWESPGAAPSVELSPPQPERPARAEKGRTESRTAEPSPPPSPPLQPAPPTEPVSGRKRASRKPSGQGVSNLQERGRSSNLPSPPPPAEPSPIARRSPSVEHDSAELTQEKPDGKTGEGRRRRTRASAGSQSQSQPAADRQDSRRISWHDSAPAEPDPELEDATAAQETPSQDLPPPQQHQPCEELELSCKASPDEPESDLSAAQHVSLLTNESVQPVPCPPNTPSSARAARALPPPPSAAELGSAISSQMSSPQVEFPRRDVAALTATQEFQPLPEEAATLGPEPADASLHHSDSPLPASGRAPLRLAGGGAACMAGELQAELNRLAAVGCGEAGRGRARGLGGWEQTGSSEAVLGAAAAIRAQVDKLSAKDEGFLRLGRRSADALRTLLEQQGAALRTLRELAEAAATARRQAADDILAEAARLEKAGRDGQQRDRQQQQPGSELEVIQRDLARLLHESPEMAPRLEWH